MSRLEFQGNRFRISHTVEGDGPHSTVPYPHYEDSFFITFILSGNGTGKVEGVPYPIFPGAAIVCAAEEMFYLQIDQDCAHERLTFHANEEFLSYFGEFDTEEFRQFICHPSKVGNWFSPNDYDTKLINPILEEVRDLLHKDCEWKEMRLMVLLMQILTVFRSCEKKSGAKKLQPQDENTRAICRYIGEHLDEDLSYKRLQKVFFVSRYNLGTKFPQQTGKSLTEYVILKRLLHACALVRSGVGIEDAAFRCGFNTYSHFFKEFRKHFGKAPKEYLGKK